MQFAQSAYCLKLLQAIYRANRPVLEQLKIEGEWKFTNLKKGASLADLVLSAKESEYAWPTVSALWTELTLPGRPPVLFALDGLAHINKVSAYRDPSFNAVHSHDLALVRLFVDALSGRSPMPNGGAVIAATSGNNSFEPPSQKLVIRQLKVIQSRRGKRFIPKPNPYERNYDERVYESLIKARVFSIDGINKEEARPLLEYWAASGLVRGLIDDHTVSAKWTLGGHGIIGEMERATLMQIRL